MIFYRNHHLAEAEQTTESVIVVQRYCPVLVTLEGSALWRNTFATALLHDQNWTIPLGLIVHAAEPSVRSSAARWRRVKVRE